jgi:hypothetical protein
MLTMANRDRERGARGICSPDFCRKTAQLNPGFWLDAVSALDVDRGLDFVTRDVDAEVKVLQIEEHNK